MLDMLEAVYIVFLISSRNLVAMTEYHKMKSVRKRTKQKMTSVRKCAKQSFGYCDNT